MNLKFKIVVPLTLEIAIKRDFKKRGLNVAKTGPCEAG